LAIGSTSRADVDVTMGKRKRTNEGDMRAHIVMSQPDPSLSRKQLLDHLFKDASAERVRVWNRKRIYQLYREFEEE
jgi:hypothetical protein